MQWLARSCTIAIVLSIRVDRARSQARRHHHRERHHPHPRLPPEIAEAAGLSSLGYRYDVTGVYWLDFRRWGDEFVVYTSDTGASAHDTSSAAGGALVLERWLDAPAPACRGSTTAHPACC
jgi:hypothetical protein